MKTDEIDKKYSNKLYESAYDAANMCVQCGYCLPVCPTYLTMGNEAQSPRGRINLVKMAAEGKIDILNDLKEPMELCLGCRACEVACPVNVPYSEIYESALNVIAENKKASKSSHTMPDKLLQTMLKNLFPKKKHLRTAGSFLWFYQSSGLSKLTQKTKIMEMVSKPMGQFERALPKVESPNKRYKFGEHYKAVGERKMIVAFFPGCIMDAVMSKINRQSIELLQKCGIEVVIPQNITCCGALHSHQGEVDATKKLAKQNIEAFEELGVTYLINNAGGCGAMLYEYDKLLADEPEWKNRANKFVARSRDITEVLAEIDEIPYEKEWRGVITYQDSCHLRNVQGVIDPPRKLLKSIPGATFVELKNSHLCCASGGIYNLLHFEESMEILDEKMLHVIKTEASTIVTTNPGCLLQMRLGIERSGSKNKMQGLHLMEVIAEACGIN
ncbi:glycolate oxidase [Sporosarcina ureae]|uniref:(Fe-S)-binding protein n=1 Tax=Sporosarcina ureae TaxID=1571 RepID=UPI000A16B721|nr:(Fe-S)-binding protein [Sporosarcina ureae]ARJ37706.1 glycolate oxidase [Sporosarcina ureae]